MVLKFKQTLNLKFMLKGSKTIKIMKGSKNRRGLTQAKSIEVFFAYKQTKKYRFIMTTRKFTLIYIVSGCVVRSEHRIDILNAKSIGKAHLNVFKEQFIEKTVSFGIQ